MNMIPIFSLEALNIAVLKLNFTFHNRPALLKSRRKLIEICNRGKIPPIKKVRVILTKYMIFYLYNRFEIKLLN